MKPKAPIPVTVLTGFLGAGKTTLLSHLLTQNHGYHCAIIINEFGEVSIDHQLAGNEHGEPTHEEDEQDEHEVHGQAKHSHYHDEKVRSFSIVEDRPLDLKRTEAWISELVGSMGANIYRCKGILSIQGQPKRVVFQGVQMMFDATPERFWKPDENRQSRMVFIGKELGQAKIRAGFESCLVDPVLNT